MIPRHTQASFNSFMCAWTTRSNCYCWTRYYCILPLALLAATPFKGSRVLQALSVACFLVADRHQPKPLHPLDFATLVSRVCCRFCFAKILTATSILASSLALLAPKNPQIQPALQWKTLLPRNCDPRLYLIDSPRKLKCFSSGLSPVVHSESQFGV